MQTYLGGNVTLSIDINHFLILRLLTLAIRVKSTVEVIPSAFTITLSNKLLCCNSFESKRPQLVSTSSHV